MSETCAHCGQTLPRKNLFGVRLIGKQARFLERVHKAGANGIYSEALFNHLYGVDEDGGPLSGMRILYVMASQINKKLAKKNLRVTNINGLGAGNLAIYRLEAINGD